MKYSLMTTSMVFPLFGRLQAGASMKLIQRDYAEMLSMVAGCGISAVEITGLELDVFGTDFVHEALCRAGLICGSVIQMDSFAETDPEKQEEIIETAKDKILAVKALGTTHVMLGLMAQSDVELHSENELRNALLHNIGPVAVFGKENGITITVEDTPDIRLPLCSSTDLGAILKAIPSLSLTYDTGNMLLKNEDSLAFYRALRDRVAYVHLKDMAYTDSIDGADTTLDGRRMRAVRHGEGILDFRSILRELHRDGHDASLMLEYVGTENHAASISAVISYMDGLFAELLKEAN